MPHSVLGRVCVHMTRLENVKRLRADEAPKCCWTVCAIDGLGLVRAAIGRTKCSSKERYRRLRVSDGGTPQTLVWRRWRRKTGRGEGFLSSPHALQECDGRNPTPASLWTLTVMERHLSASDVLALGPREELKSVSPGKMSSTPIQAPPDYNATSPRS